MLKTEGKITDAVIENILSWPPARRRHSPTPRRAPQRFQCILRTGHLAPDENALENLAHYIIRAAFSQERMTYIIEDQSPDATAKVIYQSRDGKTSKTFDALDRLAQLTTHIPGKNEQMVRYYGYYSYHPSAEWAKPRFQIGPTRSWSPDNPPPKPVQV